MRYQAGAGTTRTTAGRPTWGRLLERFVVPVEPPRLEGGCCVVPPSGSVGAPPGSARGQIVTARLSKAVRSFVAGGGVGGDLVMAAAHVLHEGVTGGEHPR